MQTRHRKPKKLIEVLIKNKSITWFVDFSTDPPHPPQSLLELLELHHQKLEDSSSFPSSTVSALPLPSFLPKPSVIGCPSAPFPRQAAVNAQTPLSATLCQASIINQPGSINLVSLEEGRRRRTVRRLAKKIVKVRKLKLGDIANEVNEICLMLERRRIFNLYLSNVNTNNFFFNRHRQIKRISKVGSKLKMNPQSYQSTL
jgi:hypothetical protein